MKQLLTEEPILGYPTADDPFVVDRDASLVRVGAVLSQIQDGKKKILISATGRVKLKATTV